MSPEQASGEDLDERTDIWAFGCVLYRMVTGRDAFAGRSAVEITGAILEREPDWKALPRTTPAPLRRLLGRCLEKDRNRRLRDLGEALADIDDALNLKIAEVQDARHRSSQQLLSGRRITLAVTAAFAIGAAIFWSQRRDAWTPSTSLTVSPPSGFEITLATPTLAPDGRLLVFSACTVCDTEDLTNWLPHRRPLDLFQALPIADAKGAFFFFFSPDAQSLGFGTREGLKKLSLAGGTPVTLYEGLVNGADWGQDGTIVFASESGLMRMPAAGGKPQSLTRAKPGTYHVSPAILPGNAGVWIAYSSNRTGQISATLPQAGGAVATIELTVPGGRAASDKAHSVDPGEAAAKPRSYFLSSTYGDRRPTRRRCRLDRGIPRAGSHRLAREGSRSGRGIMLTTPRIVAMLLVANTVILVTGVLRGEGSAGIERPFWLPPLWIRVGIPLAVAGGLWYGQQWAWWTAVAMCVGLLLWSGIASILLALGGYFAGVGAASRILHLSLLVGTWLTALALLLSA